MDYTNGGIKYFDGGHPAQTNYTIFCGAWALLFAIIGITAVFVEFLQGIIIGAFDVLSAIISLIGGIVYAVGLHGGSCGNVNYLQSNRLIRGAGSFTNLSTKETGSAYNGSDNLGSRCHQAQAVMVFLFFISACFLASGVLGFFGNRRKSGGRSSYV